MKMLFSIMTKLIKTNISWKKRQRTALQVEERSKQSYIIAIEMLLLKIKEGKRIVSIEEKRAIEEYFNMLQEYYLSSTVLELIEKVLLEKLEPDTMELNENKEIYSRLEEKIWLYSEENITLLQNFYLASIRMKFNIAEMEKVNAFSKVAYKMVVYRIINAEVANIVPALDLLYALVVNNVITEMETNVLFMNLPRLMQDTAISSEDFEKEARHKLNCRSKICEIAREYYKRGERNRNLLEWKELTKNPNEFVEIRTIEFED